MYIIDHQMNSRVLHVTVNQFYLSVLLLAYPANHIRQMYMCELISKITSVIKNIGGFVTEN